MIAPPDRREVVVTAEGAVLLDGQNITPQELTRKLEAMRGSVSRPTSRSEGLMAKPSINSWPRFMEQWNRAGVADLSIAVRSQAEYR